MDEWKEVFRERNTLGGIMRIGSLVRSKWLNYPHVGLVTGNATLEGESWRQWRVQWIGDNCPLQHTLEDERDLEVLCE